MSKAPTRGDGAQSVSSAQARPTSVRSDDVALPPSGPLGDNLRPARASTFLPYLEGLRGLAALYVVFFHADYELSQYRAGSSAVLPFHARFMHYGHYSVAIFIVISGYVLSLPVLASSGLPGGTFAFLKRRARRLLPGYYAALVFAVPLALYNDTPGLSEPKTLAVQFAAHALLVHNLFSFTTYGLDGPLWSVALEIQIYVIFAFILVRVWGRFGVTPMVAVALALGLAPMFWGIAHHHSRSFAFGSFWYLGLFAFGSAAAWLSRNRRFARFPWLGIATAFGAAFIGLNYTTSALTSSESVLGALDLLLGLTTAALFVSIAQRNALGKRPLAARILAARPFVALGAFSYSVYLIHEPLLILATRLLARTNVSDAGIVALVYFVVIPLVVAVAYVFSLAFERPFISSFRRRAELRLLHPEAAR